MSSKRPGHKPRKEDYDSYSDSEDKQYQGGYKPVSPAMPQGYISQPSAGGHQPNPPMVSVEHHTQPVVCPTGGPVYPQTNPQVPSNYPTGNIGSMPTNPPQLYPSGNIECRPRSPNAPGLHPTDNFGYSPSSPQAPGMYPSGNIGYPSGSPQAPGMYPSDNIGYPPTNPQLPDCGYPSSGYPQGGVSQSVGFSVGQPTYGLEHNQYGAGQVGQNYSNPSSNYVPGMPQQTSQSGGINYGYNQGGYSNYEPGVPRY